jgi:predicted HicB family RNase H-like nuclease
VSRTDPQFKLRVPPALHSQVEQAAKAVRRSMNAEIVARLEASFAKEQKAQEKTP